MVKSNRLFIFLIIISLIINSNNLFIKTEANSEPLGNVLPGWDVLTIYEIQHPPGPTCIGENNDLFFLDNLNNKVIKTDSSMVQTEYLSLDLSLRFDAFAYQPILNRFIGVTNYGFYTFTDSGVTWLKNYTDGLDLSTIVIDPIDESFYCGSIASNNDIVHFDANGNYISTLLTNVHGCSQLTLSKNRTILYYSETFDGSFSALNLSSLSTQIMRTNIGLLGTQEVIGIGVDDNDDLYYMTADGLNSGFYKYESGIFNFIMASKHGMSALTWSSKLQIFIAAGSAGGCLIGYDPTKTTADILSPYVNSASIIETMEGVILYADDDEIYQINSTGSTYFTEVPYHIGITELILDIDDNMFALLANDSVAILRVNHDGSFNDWLTNEIHEWSKTMCYDVLNNDIILLTEDSMKNESYVYRIPIENPLLYTKIAIVENSTKTAITTDIIGNIFVYEAYNDTLYKIPNGFTEKVVITDDFIDFSDIYGVDLIMVPSIGYCSIENGIFIGRNDDLQIWFLDEGFRGTFAVNKRGIDNSGIYETFNHEVLITQSTLVLKLIFQEQNTTPTQSSTNNFSKYYLLPLFMDLGILLVIQIRKYKNKRINI